jgi:hypothetical protein
LRFGSCQPALADEELQHRAQRPDRFQRLASIGERVGGTEKTALATDKAHNRAMTGPPGQRLPCRRWPPPQPWLSAWGCSSAWSLPASCPSNLISSTNARSAASAGASQQRQAAAGIGCSACGFPK